MVRLTDRPDMTLDVYRGRKTTMQQQQNLNIYMAKYLRIDIRSLSAINGARNNISNCQSNRYEADYYFFK